MTDRAATGDQERGPDPLAVLPPGKRPQRLRRALGCVRWIVAAVLLILIGAGGYSAFRLAQFQHAIYQPLPTLVPTLAPTLAAVTALPSVRTPPVPLPTSAADRAPLPLDLPTIPLAALPAQSPTSLPLAVPTEAPAAQGRINILLLGTDKRPEVPEAAARSDTLMILSVDPHWKTAGLLSVPRDLQVLVPGYGLQKINAAYFFGEYAHLPGGGPTLAVPTVSQYFGVPIQYYVAINFAGFEQVINLLDGIDVVIPAAIDDPLYPGPNNTYRPIHFDAGCQHLNGARALEYARTRHSDSDFGRNRRQQQVIQAVRARVFQLDMVPRYDQLLSQLGDSIQTNIPPEQQSWFAQLMLQIPAGDLYTAAIDNTLVDEIPGTSALALRQEVAQPLLDGFFGRGPYATLKPGTRLSALPATTPSAVVNAAVGGCP